MEQHCKEAEEAFTIQFIPILYPAS